MSKQRGWSVGHPVSVGFGGAVAGDRIVALANPGSAPIQRAVRRAREEGRLIDLTFGRRIRTVLFMDSGHVIRTAISPETLLGRWSEVKRIGCVQNELDKTSEVSPQLKLNTPKRINEERDKCFADGDRGNDGS